MIGLLMVYVTWINILNQYECILSNGKRNMRILSEINFFANLKKCPKGQILQKDPSYKPTTNGCGPQDEKIVQSITRYVNPYFGECCNGHDICYGTCNPFGKIRCDKDLLSCMIEISNRDFPNDWIRRYYYKGLAFLGFWLVYFEGEYSFIGGQNVSCMCK